MKDLRFQLAVIAALRTSCERIKERILQLGGGSPSESRIEAAGVNALETSLFTETFVTGLDEAVRNLLTGDELEQFGRDRSLYTRPVGVDVPLKPPTPNKVLEPTP